MIRIVFRLNSRLLIQLIVDLALGPALALPREFFKTGGNLGEIDVGTKSRRQRRNLSRSTAEAT